MAERDWLAQRFEEHRDHLRGVAYRMLGSLSEADDAVQEAWLRLSRAGRERRPESRRMADDGGGAGVPRHAALAQRARREEPMDEPGRRSGRGPSGRERSRARGGPGRVGRTGAPGRAGDAGARRAARVRAARHVRGAVRRDRVNRRAHARQPRGSSPAALAGGCRARPRSPAEELGRQREVVDAFLAAAARWRLRGDCWRCSIRTSRPARRPGDPRRAQPGPPARWPTRGPRGSHSPRWSTGRSGWSWPRAAGCSGCSASRSRTGRSCGSR